MYLRLCPCSVPLSAWCILRLCPYFALLTGVLPAAVPLRLCIPPLCPYFALLSGVPPSVPLCCPHVWCIRQLCPVLLLCLVFSRCAPVFCPFVWSLQGYSPTVSLSLYFAWCIVRLSGLLIHWLCPFNAPCLVCPLVSCLDILRLRPYSALLSGLSHGCVPA